MGEISDCISWTATWAALIRYYHHLIILDQLAVGMVQHGDTAQKLLEGGALQLTAADSWLGTSGTFNV